MTLPKRVALHSISKSYSGTHALRDVSFSIAPGCIHAIVGENGAGKSTLVKILAGAVRPDRGMIRIDGVDVVIYDVNDAQRLGIALVHQELNLVPHLSVGDNVFLGRWPRGVGGVVRARGLARATEAVFGQLGLRLSSWARVNQLSIAQQQMVEIARALSIQSRVLILDEPSAILTPKELDALFAVVRELRSRGVSIVYISHRLDEIFALADFVTVLRDGTHVSTRPIAEVERGRLIAEVVGRPLNEEFPWREARLGDDVLVVDHLTVPSCIDDVTFRARRGEVFGLTGMVGSGRTTVGRAIFGAIASIEGEVCVGERRGPFRSPREAQRAGVAFVPEDRRREGLLLARAVRENVTLAHLRELARGGVVSGRRERAATRWLMDSLRIKARSSESAVATLSGGNQQKTMLARWMMKPYEVMILDEPTRGVDVGAKAEIYELINSLAGGGTAIVMVSSELPEVIGMCDRIGVMCRGRLATILDNGERQVTQETILRHAVGDAR